MGYALQRELHNCKMCWVTHRVVGIICICHLVFVVLIHNPQPLLPLLSLYMNIHK